MISRYWFKKHNKKNSMPTSWEGWALFTIFVGSITQVYRFVDGMVQIFFVCIVITALYFTLVKVKTDPSEVFDKDKDKITYKHLLGGLFGLVIFLAIFLGISTAQIQYQHSAAGSVVKLNDEKGWVKFYPKNDSFTIEVPVYPEYSTFKQLIEGSDIRVTISVYESKLNSEDYLITITGLLEDGDYSDFNVLFSNAIMGMKSNLKQQTNEEPTINISPIETFLTYPSQSFSVEGISSDYKIAGVLFVAESKVYMVSYNSDKTHFNEENKVRFINSMKFEK